MNIKYKCRIYNFLLYSDLGRHRLSGVVSLLDVVVHHQITKQLPGVFSGLSVEARGLFLVSGLVKTVVVVLPLYPQ